MFKKKLSNFQKANILNVNTQENQVNYKNHILKALESCECKEDYRD